jgi:tRNA threonylcarbamoyladenosine biosynthesis protein TsaB
MSAPHEQKLLLAIECSNPSAAPAGEGLPASISLGRTGVMAVVEGIASSAQPSGRGGHDDDLLPAIARAACAMNASPRDIGTVAVSLGPGGYTSLRIAVAAAKMIAMATGAKLVGVPTALVAARTTLIHRAAAVPTTVLVALASKNDAASLTLLRTADGDLRRPLQIVSNVVGGADAVPVPVGPAPVLIADQFLPATIAAAAARLGYERVPLALNALFCADSAEVDNLPFSDPHTLAPIYAREPDAVTLWRTRHPSSPA